MADVGSFSVEFDWGALDFAPWTDSDLTQPIEEIGGSVEFFEFLQA
jgi:hypothetical protein